MKSMRSRVLGITRRGTGIATAAPTAVDPDADTPEANVVRCVQAFCEAGHAGQSGEEVIYLPTIIESAESSPNAATVCANMIRKYLTKDYASKTYAQYNAVMLIRILADNPGPTFTRNIDAKFVQTVKELLRSSKDKNVHHLLLETMNYLANNRTYDETLQPLLEMWKKEQEKMSKSKKRSATPPPTSFISPPGPTQNGNFFTLPRAAPVHEIPPPDELVSRVEEAKTSAKLLVQLLQSTPPREFFDNELIQEFSERCRKASRSFQHYMQAENPPPDIDTMQTLIETSEILSDATSRHNRAVLEARRALGTGSPASGSHGTDASASRRSTPPQATTVYAPPPGPPPRPTQPVERSATVAEGSSSSAAAADALMAGGASNPFSDPSDGRDSPVSFNDEDEYGSVPTHSHAAGKRAMPVATAGLSTVSPAGSDDETHQHAANAKQPAYKY